MKTKVRLNLTDLTPSSTINFANETLQRAVFTLRNQMRAHHSWVKKISPNLFISIFQKIKKNYDSSFGGTSLCEAFTSSLRSL